MNEADILAEDRIRERGARIKMWSDRIDEAMRTVVRGDPDLAECGCPIEYLDVEGDHEPGCRKYRAVYG